MKALLLALLRGYRYLLSPWIGGSCRYWPTCSEYASEAIEAHGAARGSYLAMARLARCHPYGAGGVDPVPTKFRLRCWCAAGQASNNASGAAGLPDGGARISEQ
jgi:putative membrane protein insertion efficiency factor